MQDLKTLHCQPLEGQSAFGTDEIKSHLAALPGWQLKDGSIEKHYEFADYHRTLAFVNALAFIAHAEDHHPELRVTYNRCVVRYDTHSVNGISINDFICAAKVDALLS
jgi:4a-hydroxytetrahydrobiopterin dehydratase